MKKKPREPEDIEVMDELELLKIAEYLDPSDDNDTLCNAQYRLYNDKIENKHNKFITMELKNESRCFFPQSRSFGSEHSIRRRVAG